MKRSLVVFGLTVFAYSIVLSAQNPSPNPIIGVTRRVDPGFKRQIVSGINQTSGVEPSVPVLL